MHVRTRVSVWSVLTLFATACASGGGSSDPAPPTVQDDAPAAPVETPDAPPPAEAGGGFFSQAQVDRGSTLFSDICSECHYASEMSDRNFQFAWRRQTVGDLYELIAETMPESSPGGLAPSEYADVVAYILELNGFEAGDEDMPPDAAALEVHSLAPISN